MSPRRGDNGWLVMSSDQPNGKVRYSWATSRLHPLPSSPARGDAKLWSRAAYPASRSSPNRSAPQSKQAFANGNHTRSTGGTDWPLVRSLHAPQDTPASQTPRAAQRTANCASDKHLIGWTWIGIACQPSVGLVRAAGATVHAASAHFRPGSARGRLGALSAGSPPWLDRVRVHFTCC